MNILKVQDTVIVWTLALQYKPAASPPVFSGQIAIKYEFLKPEDLCYSDIV